MLLAHCYALNIAGCTEIVSRRRPAPGSPQALARGEALPDRAQGVALFADYLVLYTARRGTEALVSQINAVYDALIVKVERYGGSLIGFAGNWITCWFRRPCSAR